jgi:formylglycine-generating enzyme required for sulfatase activity
MWFQVLSVAIGAALVGKATIALTAPRRFYAVRQRQYATESLSTKLLVAPATSWVSNLHRIIAPKCSKSFPLLTRVDFRVHCEKGIWAWWRDLAGVIVPASAFTAHCCGKKLKRRSVLHGDPGRQSKNRPKIAACSTTVEGAMLECGSSSAGSLFRLISSREGLVMTLLSCGTLRSRGAALLGAQSSGQRVRASCGIGTSSSSSRVRPQRQRIAFCAVVVGVLVVSTTAQAQTAYVWQDATTSWTTPAAWAPGGPDWGQAQRSQDALASFGSRAAIAQQPNIDDNVLVRGISIDNSQAAWNISRTSGQLNLYDGGLSVTGVGTKTTTLSASVNAQSHQTWTIGEPQRASASLSTDVLRYSLAPRLTRRPLLANSLGMELIRIPAGSFEMGSDETSDGANDERPRHRVRITQAFYLGENEVTQGEWSELMKTQPWQGKDFVRDDPTCPAVYISWEDASSFCAQFTAAERKSGRLPAGWRYALPTEAQWEYACRAGSTTEYSFGDDPAQLGAHAWFDENAHDVNEQYAHSISITKRVNAWGLHHLHGNVLEWCEDWYREDYYATSAESDPRGPESGTYRVYRGGSWGSAAGGCRSAFRFRFVPSFRSYDLGFRLALVPPGQ